MSLTGRVRALNTFKNNRVALRREAWRNWFSGALAALSIPPSRWPMRWHFVGAAAALLAIGLVNYQWHQLQLRAARQAEATLQNAQAGYARLQQQPRPTHITSGPGLARPQLVDDVIRDLGKFAITGRIRLASVQIEHGTETASAARQVRVVARAHGEYLELKSWLGELLARYPALAISSASMRSLAADNRQLDATVAFVLFVRPAP